MGASDRYCLRWNNHQRNFLTGMNDLLENETFTDVTLGVDDGRFIKCHKIILATCSSYFRTMFIEVPCKHPVVLLKDVKYTEIKAILDFMYKGEVSVARDEMAALLKVAELLKVKGLVADDELSSTTNDLTSSPSDADCNAGNGIVENARSSDDFPINLGRPNSTDGPYFPHANSSHAETKFPMPTWPLSQSLPSDDQRLHAALTTFHPLLAKSFLYSNHEATTAHTRRHSISNMTRHRDTLLNMNNKEHEDRTSRSPVIRRDSHDSYQRHRNNGSLHESEDRRSSTDLSHRSRPQSPLDNDALMMDDDEKRTSNQTYPDDARSGVSNYSSSQKQEGKRYKKYSTTDLANAIEAVKGGMSANKAAELFNVPSRTLYDKIKRLGIVSMKHRRSENVGSAGYSLLYNDAGNLNIGACDTGLVNANENSSSPIDHPTSMVETTFAETFDNIREKLSDQLSIANETNSDRCPVVHSQQLQPSDESSFRDNDNEAEDLTISRSSNVGVIISPKLAIKETA